MDRRSSPIIGPLRSVLATHERSIVSDPIIAEPTTVVPSTSTTLHMYQCPGVLPPMWVPDGQESICPKPTVITTTTTQNVCPPGFHWNSAIGSPGWCSSDSSPEVTAPATTAAPPSVDSTSPTTIDPCGDFSTPEICAQYQEVHSPVGQAKVVAAVAQKPKTAHTLPATGNSSDTPTPIIGCGVLILGAFLVAITKRRNHAKA